MKTDTRCRNDILYKFTFRRNTGWTILGGHLCRRYLLRGLILQKWAGKRIKVLFANSVSAQLEIMGDIYHKAARDSVLELLKTATKRDANRRDEDGMSPVHYAASCGNVEALRLLVGKG